MKTTSKDIIVPPKTKTDNLWNEFRVSWLFLTKLCASVPADPEIVKKWQESRQPAVKPAGGKSIDEIQEEVFQTLQEGREEYSGLVFQREAGRLVQRAATVKAHIKDCARVLSAQYIGRIQGERAFSTRVINGVYPDETQYWLPILRADGVEVTEADGTFDKPVHARGPRGEPINALKTFEYVDGARIDFILKVLGKSVSVKDLETLFQYGGVHGFAGERSDGEGRYTFSIEPID